MGRKAILMIVDGGVRKATLAKPQAPRTLGAWFRAAQHEAVEHRAGTFAFWAQGKWYIFHSDDWRLRAGSLVKEFAGKDSQDAVEVYMLTIGARHG